MPDGHPPLRLGIEIEGASRAFDIEDRWSPELNRGSFIVTLLQMAGAHFRDQAIERQANETLQALQPQLVNALQSPGVGYLLEVSIFSDEFGNIVVPGGQVVYAVGLGIDPMDALAEHLRQPRLRDPQARPANLRNETYFVWVTRVDDQMVGRTIPAQFRQGFLQTASTEARRRNLMAGWNRSFPKDVTDSVVRAQFWTDVAATRAVILTQKGLREEAEKLTSQMQQLEQKVNALYSDYQRAAAALARSQAQAATLHAIGTIAEFLKAGIEAGQMLSSSNQPVTGADLKPEPDRRASIETTAEVQRSQERVIRVLTGPPLKREIEIMRSLDNAMDDFYRRNDIPIPSREPIRVPELPEW